MNAHLAGVDFIQWLIMLAKEDKWPNEEVGSIVWRENRDGTVILSLLGCETQKQVANWSPEETKTNAHLMGTNFVEWLIHMALEENWPKEDVGSIVCSKNADNQLILATLNEETQKEVAVFNKAKTCSALPYMEKVVVPGGS